MSLSVDIVGAAVFLVTAAGLIFRAGRTENKIREAQAQTTKDLNGIGSRQRKMIAEQIIQSKERPDFEEIVRRLLG